jgi:hypothetical protein
LSRERERKREREREKMSNTVIISDKSEKSEKIAFGKRKTAEDTLDSEWKPQDPVVISTEGERQTTYSQVRVRG